MIRTDRGRAVLIHCPVKEPDSLRQKLSAMKKNNTSVAIDVRMAAHTGIGRYIRGFVGALVPDDSIQINLIGNRQSRTRFSGFPGYRCSDAKIYGFREQIDMLQAAKYAGCLHVPHFNIPVLWTKKLIVTIHDLIHLRFSQHLSNPLAYSYAKFMISRAVSKADAIIAVSEYGKKELVEMFWAKPEKITVIHHGIAPEFFQHAAGSTGQFRHPYFLYVGLIKAHKNTGLLIQAFQKLRDEKIIPNLKLRLIGRLDEKQKIVRNWKQMIISDPDIIHEPSVDETNLVNAYQNALAVVQPSFYEGFGFPIVEAMASGAPVIGANATSIPEVMGEGNGLRFDPNSKTDLVNQMRRIMTDPALRNELAGRGIERAKSFSWRTSAEKHMDVYRRVLGL